MLGFLGRNGAGKTTAMRAVFGLVQVDAGEVLWLGRPAEFEERLRFGYMPEERGLYPRMPVREQVEYFGRLHGLDARSARAAAATWLEQLPVQRLRMSPSRQRFTLRWVERAISSMLSHGFVSRMKDGGCPP